MEIKFKDHRIQAIRLSKIATVERARKDKIYPKGTILVQISATKGQVKIVWEDRKVDSQYATIRIDKEWASDFKACYAYYYAIKETSPRFFHKVQNGLNIKAEDVGDIPVPVKLLYMNDEERQHIGKMNILAQQHMNKLNEKVNQLKKIKQELLNDMFPD